MDKDAFFSFLIMGGIFLILISPLFVVPKFIQAKHFCKSIEGNYSYSFNGTQYCNNKIIQKYYSKIENKVFWDFEDRFLINKDLG